MVRVRRSFSSYRIAPLDTYRGVAGVQDYRRAPIGAAMYSRHEDHRELEPLGGMDGHDSYCIRCLRRRRFRFGLPGAEGLEILQYLGQRARVRSMLAAEPSQQFVDVSLR